MQVYQGRYHGISDIGLSLDAMSPVVEDGLRIYSVPSLFGASFHLSGSRQAACAQITRYDGSFKVGRH